MRPSQQSSRRLPGIGQRIGEFTVEGLLGRGGMGAVYLVQRQGVRYALKLMTSDEGSALERFEREGQAIAAVDQHPNIVSVRSLGWLGPQPYLILDYVPGRSLEQVMAEGALPLDQSLDLLETIARALETVHARGILHRDLKPGNILLRPDGVPMLTDFGLARSGDRSSLTQSSALLGTPSYMAPEQAGAEHDSLGPHTDTWALGAILYELSTGHRPFGEGAPITVCRRIMFEPPRAPRELNPELPENVEAIILRALTKAPGERFASAGEFAEAIAAARRGEAIAGPPRPSRRRSIAAGITALALALGGFPLLGQLAVQNKKTARQASINKLFGAARNELDELLTKLRAGGDVQQRITSLLTRLRKLPPRIKARNPLRQESEALLVRGLALSALSELAAGRPQSPAIAAADRLAAEHSLVAPLLREAKVRFALTRGHASQAIDELKTWRQLQPRSKTAKRLLIRSWLALGRWPEALKASAELLRANPNDFAALALRCRALSAYGRANEALAMLSERSPSAALERLRRQVSLGSAEGRARLIPKLINAPRTWASDTKFARELGRALLSSGRFIDLIELLGPIAKRDKSDPEIRLHVARATVLLADFEIREAPVGDWRARFGKTPWFRPQALHSLQELAADADVPAPIRAEAAAWLFIAQPVRSPERPQALRRLVSLAEKDPRHDHLSELCLQLAEAAPLLEEPKYSAALLALRNRAIKSLSLQRRHGALLRALRINKPSSDLRTRAATRPGNLILQLAEFRTDQSGERAASEESLKRALRSSLNPGALCLRQALRLAARERRRFDPRLNYRAALLFACARRALPWLASLWSDEAMLLARFPQSDIYLNESVLDRGRRLHPGDQGLLAASSLAWVFQAVNRRLGYRYAFKICEDPRPIRSAELAWIARMEYKQNNSPKTALRYARQAGTQFPGHPRILQFTHDFLLAHPSSPGQREALAEIRLRQGLIAHNRRAVQRASIRSPDRSHPESVKRMEELLLMPNANPDLLLERARLRIKRREPEHQTKVLEDLCRALLQDPLCQERTAQSARSPRILLLELFPKPKTALIKSLDLSLAGTPLATWARPALGYLFPELTKDAPELRRQLELDSERCIELFPWSRAVHFVRAYYRAWRGEPAASSSLALAETYFPNSRAALFIRIQLLVQRKELSRASDILSKQSGKAKGWLFLHTSQLWGADVLARLSAKHQ